MKPTLTPQEESVLATFLARPEWRVVRPLLERVVPGSVDPLDSIIYRVRRELWRDHS